MPVIAKCDYYIDFLKRNPLLGQKKKFRTKLRRNLEIGHIPPIPTLAHTPLLIILHQQHSCYNFSISSSPHHYHPRFSFLLMLYILWVQTNVQQHVSSISGSHRWPHCPEDHLALPPSDTWQLLIF